MRWIIYGALAGLLAAGISSWIIRQDQQASQDQQQQTWLQWETCVLNDTPGCGPMPQP